MSIQASLWGRGYEIADFGLQIANSLLLLGEGTGVRSNIAKMTASIQLNPKKVAISGHFDSLTQLKLGGTPVYIG
jgi:hypothetical protein